MFAITENNCGAVWLTKANLKAQCLLASVLLNTITIAYADSQTPAEDTFLDRIAEELDYTWHAKDYEWYIPINTWHNRYSYTPKEIAKFNENPWGIGIGKYRYDPEGDWHGMYSMVFLDSNNDWEPVVGYAFQKIWPFRQSLKLGLGYTVGITFRHKSGYIPLPLILPLISIKYHGVALQSTYVPGGEGNGNVLFTWIRWEM